ncbi:hypothetical protein DFH07DRAFT_51197 [Mycena maculata]|uniref:DUF6534 domain-containing protein n=1 Tax=Mycena maculata TaxID=230809 RepID=A0AAD7IF86_9AGAR|nr:hypothetical protein DFH07DRAFT_51197 [Mycena maculata]
MATPAPALPNVQLLYGPMIIGVFFNMILYGVLVGQMLAYYQVYKKDALWMRLFVAFLFFVETCNTALDMSMMYQPLILEYGHKPVFFPSVFMARMWLLLPPPWCLITHPRYLSEPLCVVLISMPIQLFFAWRIHQLTNSLWIPLVISIFALGSFAGGIWTATMVQILREFAKKPLLHNSALLWFLASCVADVLITISLVMTLTKKKTGFVATDSVLDKIIRTTIQTGMVTAIFSILDVVCFMALPHYAVNFVWDLALSKLYSNCLMSTLNARQKLNSASHASTFQQRNVVLSPSRGGSGGGSGKQESFLDSSPGPMGSVTYDGGAEAPDLEYGIHMTKIVERMKDPVPRAL